MLSEGIRRPLALIQMKTFRGHPDEVEKEFNEFSLTSGFDETALVDKKVDFYQNSNGDICIIFVILYQTKV